MCVTVQVGEVIRRRRREKEKEERSAAKAKGGKKCPEKSSASSLWTLFVSKTATNVKLMHLQGICLQGSPNTDLTPTLMLSREREM